MMCLYKRALPEDFASVSRAAVCFASLTVITV